MTKMVFVLARRLALPVLAATIVLGLWVAFPQPVPGLWPPVAPDGKHLLYVTLNGYHTALDFPDHRFGLFQVWDMSAAVHYQDRDPEYFRKIVKAFFRPIPATVRFNLFVRPYWHRMNLTGETVYTFWLSPAGKAALEAYLHRMRGPKVKFDGEFHLFACTRPWTPLSNCNGFIGGALRAAGLPIREALALEGTTMRWQLERCRRFQDEWLAAGGFRPPRHGFSP